MEGLHALKKRSHDAVSRLRGVITPLLTPFKEDGEVDLESLARLVEYQVESEVDALFVYGSTGEFAALTEPQRRSILDIVLEKVAGRVPVLVGAADNSTRRVIERCREAERAGADAVVVAVPFYHMISQHEAVNHFSSIRDAIDIPVYAYDVPSLVKVKLSTSTVVELASRRVIQGLKDSSGDISSFRQVLIRTQGLEGFQVFTGMELLADVAVFMGAHGIVAGLANVAPREYVELTRACFSKEWDKARALQEKLTRLFDIVYIASGEKSYSAGALSAFKAALKCKGILTTCVMAPPMSTLNEEEQERVGQLVRRLGLS